jgi:hypothetical protein
VAIARNGRFIVPHGDTVIEEGDLVTVIGDGANRAAVVATFCSGVELFPSEFGSWIAVGARSPEDLEGPVAEALHLARVTAAEGLLLVHEDPGSDDGDRGQRIGGLISAACEAAGNVPVRMVPVRRSPVDALLSGPVDDNVGMVVVPARPAGRLAWRRDVARALRLVGRTRMPLLYSRGTHPYRRIVAPARESAAALAADEVAIDLGAYHASPVVGIAVVPPQFISTGSARDEATRAVARLQENAELHGVEVRRVVRQGNEVRIIGEWADANSLVVLGSRRRGVSALTPGIAGHLLNRLPSSVLIVPAAPD